MRDLISPEQRALFPEAIKEISFSLTEKISRGEAQIPAQSSFLGHGVELTALFLRTSSELYKDTEYDNGNWMLGLGNAARSGFYASSQVMNLATPAYIEHCEGVGADLDPREFSNALLRRQSFQNVLLFLANMHVDKNSAFEYHLGLKQTNHSLQPGNGNYGENSFVIEAEQEVLILGFNPYVFSAIMDEPDVVKKRPEDGRRCPAIFAGSLERLWQLQVETALQLGVTSSVFAGVKEEILQRQNVKV